MQSTKKIQLFDSIKKLKLVPILNINNWLLNLKLVILTNTSRHALRFAAFYGFNLA